ncbi:ATP-dependent RNA helicase [Hydrogenovibrio sp. SC-1]|uniref:DEAD/DEAH box helicase n=1 Tax=Hydrogenovibrio sp. SC-1 TaxID=2065820 RepID=UPI000C7C1041|nr:DEAD/DEAH box helicase [Hydrogenovibrio sp. SC-1]PLA74213.1 ATP-dependent RNA helicase [Hydrogenovibrio sp. SC-1]
MSFANLGLCAEILEAVSQQGYETPSPIQAQAIPAVIGGQDVMAAAQTGTGKTAGFTLPILQRIHQGPRVKPNQARVLILTPTRELAAQVSASVETYGKNLSTTSTVVFGGVKINPQMMRLRKGVDILVATPGRLLDLYQQNAIKFDQLEILVLDEADRMLDMGFIHDIKRIIKVLPKERQNLLFSATFSNEIRQLAKGLVNNPVEISVSPRNAAATTVTQWICPVDKGRKAALLIHLIKTHQWHQVLIFSRTKHGANRLTKQLETKGIKAAAIHGNKSQGARTQALARFKAGEIQALVATDIAARGIDIDQLPQVVNFDLPNVPEDYVHRIGRTGRAGAEGQAVSLVSADEIKQLSDIENLIQKLLTRKRIEGFEPTTDLPETRLNHKPKKMAKPKKPKRKPMSAQTTDSSQETPQPKRSRPKKPSRSPHSGSPKTGH